MESPKSPISQPESEVDSASEASSVEAPRAREQNITLMDLMRGLETYGKCAVRVAFARAIMPPTDMDEVRFCIWGEIATLVCRHFMIITPFHYHGNQVGIAFFIWLQKMEPSIRRRLEQPPDQDFEVLWREMRAKWTETVNETNCFAYAY